MNALWEWHRESCLNCGEILPSVNCIGARGRREERRVTEGLTPPSGEGWTLVPGQVPPGKVNW